MLFSKFTVHKACLFGKILREDEFFYLLSSPLKCVVCFNGHPGMSGLSCVTILMGVGWQLVLTGTRLV